MAPLILKLGTEGKWSVSRPVLFTPGQIFSMHRTGGYVGPRSSLGSLENNNVLTHTGHRTTIRRDTSTLTTPNELYPQDVGLLKNEKYS